MQIWTKQQSAAMAFSPLAVIAVLTLLTRWAGSPPASVETESAAPALCAAMKETLPVFPAPPARVVYDNGLKNGWIPSGAAAVLEWTDAQDIPAPGATSIHVKLDGGAQALILRRLEPMRLDVYDRLSFQVNGGEWGGQTLMVAAAKSKGKPLCVMLPPMAAGKWKTVTIPFRDLGIVRESEIRHLRFWLTKSQPDFYLANIHFLKPGEVHGEL